VLVIRRTAVSALFMAFAAMLCSCAGDPRTSPPKELPVEGPGYPSFPAVDPEESLALFAYDAGPPLDVREERRWHEENATCIDLSYASPKGGSVPATLVQPDGDGPHPGIVLQHGMPADRRSLHSTALALARWGAVVVSIDAPFNRRSAEVRPQWRSGVPLWMDERDRDEQVQLIVDLRRAVDLLLALPDVDGERLAYVGVSYGGAMGGLLAGVEDRITAYALQVGDGGLVTHIAGQDARERDAAGSPFGMLSDEERERWVAAMWPIEPVHFVGRAAPAALLFQNGTLDDSVAPLDAARYQEAGSEPKTVLWYASGHSIPPQAWADFGIWLQEQFGPRLFVFGPDFDMGARLILDRLLVAWLALAAASLVVIIVLVAARGGMSWLERVRWVLGTLGTGLFAPAAWLVSRAGSISDGWRGAAAAAVKSAGAALVGILLYTAVVSLLMPGGVGNSFLFLVYVLPIGVGLMVAAVARRDRGGRLPLPAEVAALNLVLAGWLVMTVVSLSRLVTVAPAALPTARLALAVAAILVSALGAGSLLAWPVHLLAMRAGRRPLAVAGVIAGSLVVLAAAVFISLRLLAGA
jgi:hypothetical protein